MCRALNNASLLNRQFSLFNGGNTGLTFKPSVALRCEKEIRKRKAHIRKSDTSNTLRSKRIVV